MRLLSRDPKDFHTLLTKKAEADDSIVLHGAGIRGLQAETTKNDKKPKETEAEERITKAALIVVLKIIFGLMRGRPVKLISDKKSWVVCFGPANKEGKKGR